jgi:hypothetical protein
LTTTIWDRVARFAWLVAVPFAFGAVHHVGAVVSPNAADTSSPTRHLVFVVINLFFCVAFAVRARWAIFPAALLAIQQARSHGSAFIDARHAGIFDGESFAVLVFLPVFLIAAFALFRAHAPKSHASDGANVV